jgi:tRNA-dihydrouridine synthase
VVNGDIVDAPSARRALALSGADAVMVGRAALGRPWLPGAIARALEQGGDVISPPLSEHHAAFEQQYRAMLDLYGEPLGVRAARKHLAAFIDTLALDLDAGVRRAARVRLCQAASPEGVLAGLAALVAGAGEGLAQAA